MSAKRWPRVLQPDDHLVNMRTILAALPEGMARRGVVHVGAHQGEEVPVFRAGGFADLVLIEPNPDHTALLERRFGGDPHVRVVAAAVGERDRTAALHVHTSRSGNTEPASLLELGELKQIVTTLHTPRTIDVPVTTLDTLVDQGTIDPSRHNLLVVDVQGAEALVFAGASQTLGRFDAIVTEVSMRPLYVGVTLEHELLQMLMDAGFEPVFSVDHELYRGDDRFVAWGECLLVRRGLRS